MENAHPLCRMSETPSLTLSKKQKTSRRAGEMAQQLEAFAALPEGLGSVPRAHTLWLRKVCNSSPRDLTPSPGLLRHTDRQTPIDVK